MPGESTALSDVTAEHSAFPATKTSRFRIGWREVALALLILFLAYQVVIPFVMIIWTSLKSARPGEPEFLSLSFTLANYARALGSASFWRTTGNTLAFASAASLVAFVLGAFL